MSTKEHYKKLLQLEDLYHKGKIDMHQDMMLSIVLSLYDAYGYPPPPFEVILKQVLDDNKNKLKFDQQYGIFREKLSN